MNLPEAGSSTCPPYIQRSMFPKGGYGNLFPPCLPSPAATLLTQSQSHGTSLPRTSNPATRLNLPLSGRICFSATRVVSLTSVLAGSTICVLYIGSRGEAHDEGLRDGGGAEVGGAGLRLSPRPRSFQWW